MGGWRSLLLFGVAVPLSARVLWVGASAEFPTVEAALRAARPGDTVRLQPGVYREWGLVVEVPIVLEGNGAAVLDAEGGGEILRVRASGVTIRGLVLRRSGVSFLRDNAAIRLDSVQDCRIERNRLEENFFGIYLARSARCTVQENSILGKAEREASAGNGIHLWYCRDILVRGNTIAGHRDGIYFEFVQRSTVEENHSERNLRYGLHFMFSDSCLYRRNRFRENRAGVAVMYSRFITMEENRFEDNWGSSVFGLLLKDIYRSRIRRNVFVHNTVGMYVEGSDHNVVDSNRFERNGWALRLMASAQRNVFRANSFVANTFDLSTNSTRSFNELRGNYWSRYRGYDLDGDGYGDVPFHPVGLFALLVERFPPVVLFLHSLLVELLELAERVFPVLTPAAIVDPQPLMGQPV
jgi:nitrous oxidase accessory protein